MNKPLLIGGGVTLAALAISPYFIGNGLQDRVNTAIDAVNEQVVYQASIASYDKGWFSSRAEIDVAIDLAALMSAQQVDLDDTLPDGNPTVKVTLTANHGPVYFGDGVGIGKVHYTVSVDGSELREYASWDETQAIYLNEGVAGLFGGLTYRDEIPAFSATSDEDGTTLSFSGYKGEATQQGDNIVYIASSDEFTVKGPALNMEMANISVNAQYAGDIITAMKGELFDSELALKIATMSFTDFETNSDVAIKDITFSADTDVNKQTNLANVYVEYGVGELNGPDMDASDMVLGVAVNNLQLDFIRAYQDFSNETLLMPAEEVPAKMMAFVQDNLLTQLKTEPEINITKLTATVPEGSFSAHANTKLVGITALPGTLEDVGYWVSHLLADATITADKAFAESMMSGYMMGQILANPQAQGMSPEEIQAAADQQAPMMINSFAQQGLIKVTEDGYETQLTLKDGKANVNGTPIPLPFAPQ